MKLPNGEVWVDKQSDRDFWSRYLRVFDKLVVCARMQSTESVGTKALRSDRPEVTYIGMPDFRGIKGLLTHYFAIQKALKRAIKEADCIMFRAPSPISLVSYRRVVKSKKPFAVELMNNPITHYSKDAMKKWYQPLVSAFITNQTKRMCRRANGVAYVTESVLQKMYPSTARINGTSDNFFESSYSTIRLEENNYICKYWDKSRPEPIVFVHSGEMVDYRKGQIIVIDALSILKEQGFPVRAIFIGDGIKRAEFEEYAKSKNIDKNTEFVGWKSGFPQVQKELLKGHIFLFPSLGEGLPRSVIEAMASGLLCFGSRIDGIVELLDDENLVDVFSGEAFADKIKPFLENWDQSIYYRNLQFERSKKYENTKLSMKRDDFYNRLALCANRMEEE